MFGAYTDQENNQFDLPEELSENSSPWSLKIELSQKSLLLAILVLLGLAAFIVQGVFGSEETIVELELPVTDASVSDSTSREFFVDVAGAVSNPGVYSLFSDARVVDALKLSGEVLSDASAQWVAQHLNLSQKVSDSQKIYVPFEWELDVGSFAAVVLDTPAPVTTEIPRAQAEAVNIAKDASAAEDAINVIHKLNVNSASQKELEELPGIGPTYAKRIIDNRPYKGLSALESEGILPNATLQKIKDLIQFSV